MTPQTITGWAIQRIDYNNAVQIRHTADYFSESLWTNRGDAQAIAADLNDDAQRQVAKVVRVTITIEGDSHV